MQSSTIMIVDDNESLSKTMSFVLKRQGYNIIICNDGREAISKAKENLDIELVFMDIKMPVMNGVETFKELKKIIPSAVVIMMTAYAVDELIQEALQEGASTVIYKPLDFEKIQSIIDKAHEDGEGAMIMIVDDDQSTREIFKKILVKRGYTIVIATNGEEAINAAKLEDIEMVFIDMNLPGLNGLEVYLKMKEIRPNIIAIMITGFSGDYRDKINQALVNSAYACFDKPLDMNAILEITKTILEKNKEAHSI